MVLVVGTDMIHWGLAVLSGVVGGLALLLLVGTKDYPANRPGKLGLTEYDDAKIEKCRKADGTAFLNWNDRYNGCKIEGPKP